MSTHGEDFRGGRFIFESKYEDSDPGLDVHQFIIPEEGLLNCFTSGSENRHKVEIVTEGVRYQLTFGFTCNPEFGIEDPKMPEHMVEASVPNKEEL